MAIETRERAPRNVPKFLNQVIALLLRSPLHRLISKNLLLLTFMGSKSGKRYTIPVGYEQRGETLLLFTDHRWYTNLLTQPRVRVRLRGKERTGTAEVVREDKELTAQEMAVFVQHHPGAARAYDVTFDAEGQPNQESLRAAAQRFMLIRIQLD